MGSLKFPRNAVAQCTSGAFRPKGVAPAGALRLKGGECKLSCLRGSFFNIAFGDYAKSAKEAFRGFLFLPNRQVFLLGGKAEPERSVVRVEHQAESQAKRAETKKSA